ncbi:MAG: hypothetical protein ACYDG2_16765, partial [Ruminiclostridium sp.]
KKTAKKRCNELYKWIKETIQDLGRSSVGDVMDAEGVGEFLPDNVSSTDIQNQSMSEEAITERVKDISVKVVDRLSSSQRNAKIHNIEANDEIAATGDMSSDEDDGDGIGRKPTGDPNTSSGGIGTPASANGNDESEHEIQKYMEIGTVSARLFLTDEKSNCYKLVVVPYKSVTNGYIKISLSGEQSEVEAEIKSAFLKDSSQPLKCSKGKIFIDKMMATQKMSLSFFLDYSDNCSMEVKIYGHTL